jgi:hypothetical protein
MKPLMRPLMWLITLLVLGIACYLGVVHAQEPGRGEQLTTPGEQAGVRGQMT